MSGNAERRSTSPATPPIEYPTNPPDRLSRIPPEDPTSSASATTTGDLIRAIHRFNHRLDETIYAATHPTSNQSSNEPFPVDVPFSTVREELQGLFVARTTVEPPGSASNTLEPRRARARMNERNRYLERRRNNRHSTAMNPNTLSSLADLRHAGQQLNNASQSLRALLDDSHNILAQTNLAAEEYAGEAETNRAIKRRKLDTDITSSESPGFSYGHFGQVVPGNLKMEIESCDGGTLEGYGVGSAAYGAPNVLKNDTSVYCTKGNRCNLVLRHQGVTPFCLTELSIKGPPRDYTDPVQEGMIFVSMESNELLARTAQYQIQYAPPRHRAGLATRDPNNNRIISIRHNHDGTTTGHENIRNPAISAVEGESDDLDCRLAQIPSDFTIQNAPPFHVTTECDDSDSDSNLPPYRRQTTNHMSSRLRAFLAGYPDPGSDSESSDHDVPWQEDQPGVTRDRLQSVTRRIRLSARQQPIHSDDLAEAVRAAQQATNEAVKAVGGVPLAAGAAGPSAGLMAPLAWFFIENNKSKCTIHFDPPVSGRFILLKMWSPHFSEAGNIDIQSVVAKGFAGPRFFPVSQLR